MPTNNNKEESNKEENINQKNEVSVNKNGKLENNGFNTSRSDIEEARRLNATPSITDTTPQNSQKSSTTNHTDRVVSKQEPHIEAFLANERSNRAGYTNCKIKVSEGYTLYWGNQRYVADDKGYVTLSLPTQWYRSFNFRLMDQRGNFVKDQNNPYYYKTFKVESSALKEEAPFETKISDEPSSSVKETPKPKNDNKSNLHVVKKEEKQETTTKVTNSTEEVSEKNTINTNLDKDVVVIEFADANFGSVSNRAMRSWGNIAEATIRNEIRRQIQEANKSNPPKDLAFISSFHGYNGYSRGTGQDSRLIKIIGEEVRNNNYNGSVKILIHHCFSGITNEMLNELGNLPEGSMVVTSQDRRTAWSNTSYRGNLQWNNCKLKDVLHGFGRMLTDSNNLTVGVKLGGEVAYGSEDGSYRVLGTYKVINNRVVNGAEVNERAFNSNDRYMIRLVNCLENNGSLNTVAQQESNNRYVSNTGGNAQNIQTARYYPSVQRAGWGWRRR